MKRWLMASVLGAVLAVAPGFAHDTYPRYTDTEWPRSSQSDKEWRKSRKSWEKEQRKAQRQWAKERRKYEKERRKAYRQNRGAQELYYPYRVW